MSAEAQQTAIAEVLDGWRGRDLSARAIWHQTYLDKLLRLGVPLWAATKWLEVRTRPAPRLPYKPVSRPVWPLRPW